MFNHVLRLHYGYWLSAQENTFYLSQYGISTLLWKPHHFPPAQSAFANSSIPDSTLKKKSQSIAYHFMCEGAARDEWRMSYVNTHSNEADLLMKTLPSGEKQKGFMMNLLHHIFGSG